MNRAPVVPSINESVSLYEVLAHRIREFLARSDGRVVVLEAEEDEGS